jgi:CheY-like chemotaxis protein
MNTEPRVLVVDDNVDACEVMVAVLKLCGVPATGISDSRLAIEAAQRTQSTVAFLDIGMPHIDGYTLARMFRSAYGTEGIVLVALTAYGDEDARRQGRESGFDAHILKPASVHLVWSILRQFFPALPHSPK